METENIDITNSSNDPSAFITVVSGVAVFIIGQIIQHFFLKPIQDFMIIKGEISHKVKFHANILTNSGIDAKLVQWASGDMRDLSCQLESRYVIIPFKDILSFLKILPSREDVSEASSMLILLSNAGGRRSNEIKNGEAIDKLKVALNIRL